MKNWKKKCKTIVILIFLLSGSISPLFDFNNIIESDKINSNIDIKNLKVQDSEWYDYVVNLYNGSGVLRIPFTPEQNEIIENITATYILREQGEYLDSSKYDFSYWQKWWIENVIRLFYRDLYTSGEFINGLKEMNELALITMNLMNLSYTIEQSEQKYEENMQSIYHLTYDYLTYTDSQFKLRVKVAMDDIFTVWWLTYARAGVSDNPPSTEGSTSNDQALYDQIYASYIHDFYVAYLGNDPALGGKGGLYYCVWIETTNFNEWIDSDYLQGYVNLTYIFVLWTCFFSQGWDMIWFSQSYVDDDSEVPVLNATRYDEYITMATDGDYNISIAYEDFSGWTGSIKYIFENDTFTSDPFEEFHFGSTYTSGLSELIFGIPEEIWKEYPSCTIMFKVNATDNDMDRSNDRRTSEWTDWITAGRIVDDVMGTIHNVYTYIKTSSGWELRPLLPVYKDIYVNDKNFFHLSIANPLNEQIKITNAILLFSCPKFALTWQTLFPEDYIMEEQTLKTFKVEKYFLRPDFTDVDFTRLEINVTFRFTYIKSEIEIRFETSENFTIIKPPKPTVVFDNYYGDKEHGYFIYKTGYGQGAVITAKFRVTNHARIPVDFYHKILAESCFILSSGKFSPVVQSQILTDIDDDKSYIVEPGETKEVSFPMFVKTEYFLEGLESWITGWDISLALASVADPSGAVSAISAGYLLVLLGLVTASRIERRYIKFSSKVEWWYLHNENKSSTWYDDIDYEILQPEIDEILTLGPSDGQEANFWSGYWHRYIAAYAYGAAFILHFVADDYATYAELAADGLIALSDLYWWFANDDLLENENYNQIYLPKYKNNNLIDVEPDNEFEESIVNLKNTTSHLYADIEAQNITLSRKMTAQKQGDYNAIITQDYALMNYSRRIVDDYTQLKNEIKILNYHMQENRSKIIDSLSDFELEMAEKGLSEEQINLLKSSGLNTTQIQFLNQTMVENARNNFLVQNFTAFMSPSEVILNDFIESINQEIENLEEGLISISNEIIEIKVEDLNETILTADKLLLKELKQLRSEVEMSYQMGNWSIVIDKSKALIELAEFAAFETNNDTYLIKYRDFAIEYGKMAEENLQINLFHLTDIIINDNQQKTFTLIAQSEGSPTGDYIVETNCSWVSPVQESVYIEQYNKTIIKIMISTIEETNVIPGGYDIYIKLFLPQTQTAIDSLITIYVYDDDSSPPNIKILYTGDGTDGNSGTWNINVTDGESGLKKIQLYVDDIMILEQDLNGDISWIYTFSIQNTLGTHQIEVVALNFDEDWNGDHELNSLIHAISIIDDDTIEPVISISYSGDGTDGCPGHFEWVVSNVDDGIGGDHDSGFSNIELKVLYVSTEGLPNQEYILTPTEIGTWDLPPYLGTYTMIISATDNDDDRTLILDSLTTKLEMYEEIIDDDVDPPELSDLEIEAGIFEINISLNVIDWSGIKALTIFINGEITEPIKQKQDGDTYSFIISNQWLFERGYSEVEVFVEDNDEDRPNDSLISFISGSFKNVLFQMYEYVDWQLEELQIFIEENLCSRTSHMIVKKLSQAQYWLSRAFNFTEIGDIPCGLCYDVLAKLYVEIAEHMIEVYYKLDRISDDVALYILYTLHDIRNNIIYVKGATTGMEISVDISYLEVNLLNLIDFIEENVKSKYCNSLVNEIRVAAELLELSILLISLDEDPMELLSSTQSKLNHAICTVNHLLRKGKISQELADYLTNIISQLVEDIQMVKDNLTLTQKSASENQVISNQILIDNSKDSNIRSVILIKCPEKYAYGLMLLLLSFLGICLSIIKQNLIWGLKKGITI